MRPPKRAPGVFLVLDVVLVFGSIDRHPFTGVIVAVDEDRVKVAPRGADLGGDVGTWVSKTEIRRIGGKGGKRMNGRPGRKPNPNKVKGA